jgi:hypothetical protein
MYFCIKHFVTFTWFLKNYCSVSIIQDSLSLYFWIFFAYITGYTHQNYHMHHFHWQLLSNSHLFRAFGHPLLLYHLFFSFHIFFLFWPIVFTFVIILLPFIFYYVGIHLIWVIKLLLYKATFPIFLKYDIILKSHTIAWILKKFPIQNIALYNIYFHQYSQQIYILNYWNKHS